MTFGSNMSQIATLIGSPSRSLMLSALMGGEALTATELAIEGGVTKPTASGHLRKMLEGGLLRTHSQGRHRYYALASPDVAHMLETLISVAGGFGLKTTRPRPSDKRLRKSRICYDHLAGDMGVKLLDSLLQRGFLCQKTTNTDDSVLQPTLDGETFLTELGIDMVTLGSSKRPICKTCLDWSVRRSHLAGSLGAALLSHFIEYHWARRSDTPRLIVFTPIGEQKFNKLFGLNIANSPR